MTKKLAHWVQLTTGWDTTNIYGYFASFVISYLYLFNNTNKLRYSFRFTAKPMF